MRILSLILLISLNSCKMHVEDVIDGIWSVDYFTIQGSNSMDCLFTNTFSFTENTVKLPVTKKDCLFIKSAPYKIDDDIEINRGSWKIANDNDSLQIIIVSKNPLFDNYYNIRFTGDNEKRLLILTLYNESQIIVMRKGLYNYEANLKQIKELEELTR